MQDAPPLTILQIIPRLETGGAELACIEISDALTRTGAKALVASAGGALVAAVEQAGGEHILFPAASKNPVQLRHNARALHRLIKQRHINLVHARSRAPAWSALWAARSANIPFVTTYHGAYGLPDTPGLRQVKNWYNSVMARGDRVIANSEFTADLIRTRHQTGDDRLRIVHRGVDLGAFDPEQIAPDRVARLREQWSLAPDQKIILQAARLTSWKGQRVVIEAAHLLHQQGRLGNVVFVLVGAAQGREAYVQSLWQQINAHGLADHFRLPGHCRDMPAAFKLATVSVVASTEPEAFGRSGAESQAMGCPVIATRLGAPQETVLEHPAGSRTGWLVAPGDAQALAEALHTVIGLPDDARKALGSRARQHVTRNFSSDHMKRETLKVYDELTGSALATAFGHENRR